MSLEDLLNLEEARPCPGCPICMPAGGRRGGLQRWRPPLLPPTNLRTSEIRTPETRTQETDPEERAEKP